MLNTSFKALFFLLLAFTFQSTSLSAQQRVDPSNIDIVRDEYGIPHIFTKTNAEAVYGIAWAQCEDNFHLMQDNFGFTKNMAGRLMGKLGAVLDFLYQVFQVEEFVERRYAQDITPEMENLLQAYADGVNKYAETHPKEVKRKDLLPITPKHILGNYTLHFMLMHSSGMELGKFLTKDFEYAIMDLEQHGSNAFAFSPNITEDGDSYLIGNPHQPVNEMGNFWELSVHSEEGYDFYGATFSVGGMAPTLGVNRYLGWSHTTNYQNSADIYQLEMHPTEKNMYKYDGKWVPLEVKKAKLRVKIGGITIPVKKKYYLSEYGPTFKKESGYYAFKSHIFHNLKHAEQWYKMGMAKNWEEFSAALDLQGLAAQTITYADFEGNIYHLSNFHHPYRDENIDWSELVKGNTTILPGTTSINNWTTEKIHPVADLPQMKNPKCGYVYNCNHTVYEMTAPEENLRPEDFPPSFGLLASNNVRAKTFAHLVKKHDKISFAEAREIRESQWVDKMDLSLRNCMNCGDLPQILAKTPELAEVNKVYEKWDGSYRPDNEQATIVAIAIMFFEKYIRNEFGNEEKNIPEEDIVEAMKKAEKYMLKHFGKLEVPLGEVQKAKRFDVEMPLGGSPNTLANTHVKPFKKGKVEITGGDSFVFYARFGKDGLQELHSINAFGNSLREGHPHSTDQTEMYVKQQTRKAELDLDKLRAKGKAYHPK